MGFFGCCFSAGGGLGGEGRVLLEERGVQEGGTPSQSAFKKTLLPPRLCFISAMCVSSQRSTSLKTQRTHAPHYHLVSPKTKQHGRVGVHFCTAVLVCCFSRGGGLGGVGGGGGGSIRS